MTTRTEFRVVVERDGQQWPLPNQHNEPMTDRGAAEAYVEVVLEAIIGHGEKTLDRVFVVHRQVTETAWETDDGAPWDEQAARDRQLEVANERRWG